jgi:tRNA(Ile)-lysidine synthase
LLFDDGTPDPACTAGPPLRVDLDQAGDHLLAGWGGHLELRSVTQGGVAAALLRGAIVRPRQGGEQFRLAPRAAARSLKKQFQTLGIPAWQRSGPLICTADGRLVYAPGLGVDAALAEIAGEPRLSLRWVPATEGRQSGR